MRIINRKHNNFYTEFYLDTPVGPAPPKDEDWIVTAGRTFQRGTVVAKNGTYHLDFQNDGNLVLYKDGYTILWASDTNYPDGELVFLTNGKVAIGIRGIVQWYGNEKAKFPNGQAKWFMQGDGNFVGYDASGVVLGSTNTQGGQRSYRYGKL